MDITIQLKKIEEEKGSSEREESTYDSLGLFSYSFRFINMLMILPRIHPPVNNVIKI